MNIQGKEKEKKGREEKIASKQGKNFTRGTFGTPAAGMNAALGEKMDLKGEGNDQNAHENPCLYAQKKLHKQLKN